MDKLAQVVQEEFKKIEILAERNKRETNYIVKICQENYRRLKEVFSEEINSSKDFVERVIYDNTKSLLEEIDDYGIRSYGGPPSELKMPEVLLGWIKYSPYDGGNSKNCFPSLTEKGNEIYNGWKNIKKIDEDSFRV